MTNLGKDLFDKIPEKLQDIRNTASQKKRQAPSQLATAQIRTLQSAPDVTMTAISDKNVKPPRRATTSPTIQEPWRRSSTHQEPSTLRHQVIGMDSPNRTSPQDPHNASKANAADKQTRNSPKSPTHSTSSQGPYGIQQPFTGQAVPDLTAMMFPSADPFVYPNQPMTTLENRQIVKQESSLGPSIYNLAPTTSSSYDGTGSQIYGAMSPYLMHEQQPGFGMQNMQIPISMANADFATNTMSVENDDACGWPRGSGGTPGINLDQLFGEDWGGWMNQGYRQ